jgi:hypothetical protein
MPEEEEKPLGELEMAIRKVIHVGEVPRYYANNTEIAMTSYDLSIKFAVIERADSESITVRDQAIISMSLHHAKAVAGILIAYVKQFEKQHGPIFVPTPELSEIPHETAKFKVDANS